MRSIGFSTGALAYGDFEEGLRLLKGTKATAVELSALRQNEFEPLVRVIDRLELQQFRHISMHVPSSIEPDFEGPLLAALRHLPSDWLLVTHPDVISKWNEWAALGPRLCIENMDKRKPIGRTASDVRAIFDRLPDATFCLDIGHAHQVDPTMGEAVLLLEEFSGRLRQLHVSEVNSESKHDPVSLESAAAFSVVVSLIEERIPIIVESRLPNLTAVAIQSEMDAVGYILDRSVAMELAGD
jgi:sugar phosphate isomerase/epimerase